MARSFSDQLNSILEEKLQLVEEKSTSQEAQDKLLEIMKTNFLAGRDPYGEPWTDDRKDKDHQLLYNTGELFNSFNTYNDFNSFTVENDAAYSGYINDRWKILVNDEGLPQEFMDWLNEEIKRIL